MTRRDSFVTGNSSRQADLLLPRLERFYRSARWAIREFRAGIGAQISKRINTHFIDLRARLAEAREEITRRDREHASRFDVFAYIEPDENRLSEILADLLNPRGSHGQGATFLSLFLNELKLPPPTTIETAKVYREELTTYLKNPLRRIDVLVDFGTFGLGIENKPWSLEQHNQVKDYLEHLQRQYGAHFVLVYLSGSGMPPSSVEPHELDRLRVRGQFRLMEYRLGLAPWLGRCVVACQAESVRWFLRAFHTYVSANFLTVDDNGRGSP